MNEFFPNQACLWGSDSKERISVRGRREGGSPIMQEPVPPKILVPRSWYQDLGTKILVPRFWYQDLGIRMLVLGSWYQHLKVTSPPWKVLGDLRSQNAKVVAPPGQTRGDLNMTKILYVLQSCPSVAPYDVLQSID